MADPKPRFPIRRFDVFADYHRVRNEAHGMTEDVAKGRGIWAAKVVAGRRSGGAATSPSGHDGNDKHGNGNSGAEQDDDYRSVGGELQTGETFDKEIVARMGHEFYDTVFHPAIVAAVNDGKRYEDIRDSIRKDWKS